MKKLIGFLFLFVSLHLFAQTKISEMPTLSGNPVGSYLPVIKNGVNYKVDIANTGYPKVDTVYVRNDSIFGKKNNKTTEFFISALANGTGSTIIDSTILDLDGLHAMVQFNLSHTGFKSLEISVEDANARGFLQSYTSLEAVLEYQVAIKGTYKFYITYYY